MRAYVEPERAARAWIEAVVGGDVRAHVPDLVFTETASALASYVRAGQLEYDHSDEALAAVASLPLDVVPGRFLARHALALAVTRRVSAYDACYLALAIGYDAVLVTADRRLAAQAEEVALLPRDYPPGD